MDITYTSSDLIVIEERIKDIKRRFPKFSDRKAQYWEIISRYQGESGLSERKVEYLVSCLMALDNMNS